MKSMLRKKMIAMSLQMKIKGGKNMKNKYWMIITLMILQLSGTISYTASLEDTNAVKLKEPVKNLEKKADNVIAELNPKIVPVNPALLEKYESFFPAKIIKVTEGVYVAKGYNRDNPTLIVGEDGLIIVDPGESIIAAEAVKTAFNAELDNIFDKNQ